MLTNKIIIAAIITLIAASAGGYIYSNQPQAELAESAAPTPTGFGMQPVVEPGTINTPTERAWSPADMNKLRHHK
jgi:hypothetical protein